MIDHLIRFASESAAQSDPVIGKYWRAGQNGQPGSWDLSVCIPGVEVWQPSADTSTTQTVNGQTTTIVTHHPITDANGVPYWYIMVMLPQVDPAIEALPYTLLITDRAAANAGQPFVLHSPMTTAQLATYMLQPSPLGANYPFGSPQ